MPSAPLDDYRKKRDFARTPEPSGRDPRQHEDADLQFVVHRHEARNLHYDLRLQIDGERLASFAVPKGFDYLPKTKKLAIRTEDHPLHYVDFEGVIPREEYGGGTMTIWDRGTFDLLEPRSVHDGVAAGKLEVRLRGRRLRGEWHMFRTNGDADTPVSASRHWLLFKARDRYAAGTDLPGVAADLRAAVPEPLPTRRRFMLPTTAKADALHEDPSWLHEIELAGDRVLLRKDSTALHIQSAVRRYRGAALAQWRAGLVAGIRAEHCLIDAVIVQGEPNPGQDPLSRSAIEPPLQVWALDILHFDGLDLRSLPLVQRKALLQTVVAGAKGLHYVDHVLGAGSTVARQVAAMGCNGVIAKRAGSTYRSGRSPEWLRVDVAADVAAGAEPSVADSPGPTEAPPSVTFTRLTKVYWPDQGYTKGDLLNYYASVADALLPHLVDRPVHLNRFPDGIHGKSFYQHELPEPVPDWVDYTDLPHGAGGTQTKRHPLCNRRETLLYLIQLGSIDLHPWLSTVDSLDTPDRAVFDLDPKSAAFHDVVRVARELGRLLHALELAPRLNTSGKTGLHITIDLEPIHPYEVVRTFCETVARLAVRVLSDIATVERSVARRSGRVYIDVMQNRRGLTVVPPYVARPYPGATVATPLSWDELDSDLDPAAFHLGTMPARLASLGDLAAVDDANRAQLVPLIPKLEGLLA